jgi:hypothetical protein
MKTANGTEWLAELPAHAVLDLCVARLNGALRACFRHRKLAASTCAECGQVEGRYRNAARNIYWYGEERRNLVREDTTRGRSECRGTPSGLSRCRSLSRELRHMVLP